MKKNQPRIRIRETVIWKVKIKQKPVKIVNRIKGKEK